MNEKEIMHVINAYKEGYRIQSRNIGSSDWQDDINPSWNFENYEYRVKLVPEDSTKAIWQMAEYPIQIPALVECNKKIQGSICGVPVDGFSQRYYEIRDRVEPGEYYISLYSIGNLPKKYHEELPKKKDIKNEVAKRIKNEVDNKIKSKFRFWNPWYD